MKQEVKNIMYGVASAVNTQVNESLGSLFTKEDVRVVINKIIEEVCAKVDELQDASSEGMFTKEQIANAIQDMNLDRIVHIDYGSAELDLDYNNTLSVTHIHYEVDSENLESNLFDALDNN